MKELMMKMLLLNNMNYMLNRTSDFCRTIILFDTIKLLLVFDNNAILKIIVKHEKSSICYSAMSF